MPSHIHIIEETEDGLQVKAIVRGVMQVSNTRFSRMKFNGGVLLDGKVAYAKDIVRRGQTLTLIEKEAPSYTPAPYEKAVPIVFEDTHLYIVDKPAPMASQTGSHQNADTLENAMAYRLRDTPGFIFRPVNRLDKGTSGLMVIAKSGLAHALMQKQLHTNGFERTYLAITEGVPGKREGVIDQPIGRAEGSIVKREVSANGRPAVTHYRVLEDNGRRALVFLKLQTGRTHQIRVHLSAMGCPVAGDYLYGTELNCLPGRFALHSATVAFIHPMTGEEIRMQSPLPEVLRHLLV